MTRQHWDKLNYALCNGKIMLLNQIASHKENGWDPSCYEAFLAQNEAARQALHELAQQIPFEEWFPPRTEVAA